MVGLLARLQLSTGAAPQGVAARANRLLPGMEYCGIKCETECLSTCVTRMPSPEQRPEAFANQAPAALALLSWAESHTTTA